MRTSRSRIRTLAMSATSVALALTASWAGDNPAATGFDAEGSDAKAVELADRVVDRVGGRQAWDATRYLVWTFADARHHVWDKRTGRFRVEFRDRESGERIVAVSDVSKREGRAWADGEPVDDAERLAAIMNHAWGAWVNDGYWVFLPWKLKDTGVTLEYLGEGTTETGTTAELLQLTFEGVGLTPQNRYVVYVGRDSGKIEQWDYFSNADDEEPRMRTPWADWRRYGSITLASDRGRGPSIDDLSVHDALPESVFTSPQPTGLFPSRDEDGER